MMNDTHPGAAALDLFRQYVSERTYAQQKRLKAASLRRAAKGAELKVDAFALRQQAKPLSDQSREHYRTARQLQTAMVEKAQEAQRLLTARMPSEWTSWGVVKTRAYANLLSILTTQLGLGHPKPPLIAGALSHLLTHASWDEQVLQALGTVKPDAKRLPEM